MDGVEESQTSGQSQERCGQTNEESLSQSCSLEEFPISLDGAAFMTHCAQLLAGSSPWDSWPWHERGGRSSGAAVGAASVMPPAAGDMTDTSSFICKYQQAYRCGYVGEDKRENAPG